MNIQKVDTSREAVERNWRGLVYSPAELEDLIFALLAERDALRELCGVQNEKIGKVIAWLEWYAAMHEEAAQDTRFISLSKADKKAAANYRAAVKALRPTFDRARALLEGTKS